MKAKELQIGDWVLWGEQHSNIDGDYDLEFYPHQIDLSDFFFLYVNDWEENEELEFVKPIPLDEEILKANGFKLESDGYNWYHPTYSPEQVYVHVALRKNGNVRRVEVKKQRAHFYRDTLPYAFPVHELQHALKNCSLNELADNFKVE